MREPSDADIVADRTPEPRRERLPVNQEAHRFRHFDHDHPATKLSQLCAESPDAGIMVVTESVFSVDSDSPDLQRLQSLCREHSAPLLVDVAHDLGCMGPTGPRQFETHIARFIARRVTVADDSLAFLSVRVPDRQLSLTRSKDCICNASRPSNSLLAGTLALSGPC